MTAAMSKSAAQAAKILSLEIKKIRLDGGTQSRAEIDEETVANYTEAWLAGEEFAPVVVFHDGSHYWGADCFHRVLSATRAKMKFIMAEVRTGTKRDAILYSTASNTKHGKPRSRADKRHAIEMLLTDEEWSTWSNNAIADHCHVDDRTVASARADLKRASTPNGVDAPRRASRGGTTYTINTSNIGPDAAVTPMTAATFLSLPPAEQKRAWPDLPAKLQKEIMQAADAAAHAKAPPKPEPQPEIVIEAATPRSTSRTADKKAFHEALCPHCGEDISAFVAQFAAANG